MPQDRETGAAARNRGHELAPKLARLIGAILLGSRSNEAQLGDKRIVIKTGSGRNDQVGVTYAMLDRVHDVYAAFESEPGLYSVYRLPAPLFSGHMRDSKRAGKLGLVRRRTFEELGELVLETNLD
jgi:hypothetical protein